VLNIFLCSNETDEVDDISVYDASQIDPGWGYRRPDEPECAPIEDIKNLLETESLTLSLNTDQKFVNFEDLSKLSIGNETTTFRKYFEYASF